MKKFFAALCVAAVMAVTVTHAHAQAGRANRHALIIGVGNYADARITPLRGVAHDIANATQMAQSMGVPAANLKVLKDREASYANIRRELRDLAGRVRDGDRVFLYYSGHGARFAPQDAPATCREALVPADVDAGTKSGMLTQEDIASDLAPVYAKADKVFVFIDACHSGGVRSVTRGAGTADGSEEWTPKFTALDSPTTCRMISNVRTRSVSEVARTRGAPGRNVVQLSSSRPDEVSLDSPQSGGLATSSWKYCSTYAEDTDASGNLSVAEIAACVQKRIDERLKGNPRFSGQNLVIAGNTEFAPVLKEVVAEPVRKPEPVLSTPPVAAPSPTPQVAQAEPARQRFPLESVVAQSDERHVVSVRHTSQPLRIGRDYFDLSVISSRGGFVYLILQSSDQASTYVLFPNALDQNNRIRAGESVQLPRANWRLLSRGPAGTNRLLVMVTDSPRDLSRLRALPEGPFVRTLNDLSTAQSLAWVVGSSANVQRPSCTTGFASKDLVAVDECSDSFGAALVEFQER
ncbi:caspase family protein [Rhizobacter sp. AJA081-3]|uniref:caspase family protein n=1 Tax=Rhizobacter sp. AJA081-3 TaxID=2753607 RepID=UPI001AE03849|nr:caspase family protein [Rhizobacter sp. AJA081-3]QTN22197.1 caspase family protein [Rhizobacter sp. AJA081-3]